ncbi:unnamed protein product [Brachionus calyciflorus]|uniref:Reverse transcriptase domain-containing protein n=1 Tax=Brachionus calyciflorus TaxID=104777 RepID=A0A814P5A1_9BILA|nr:unnamed protein product [Brachionus calyciflorus]
MKEEIERRDIWLLKEEIFGYWQVKIADSDKHKTAFITATGLFQFKKMPFGLCNAPATFQRLMNKILASILWKRCIVYLDDIIVYARTFEEHLESLEMVFQKLRAANLKLKLEKCSFCKNEVKYLGFKISKDGLKADPFKTQAIRNMVEPNNVRDVKSFIQSALYYRRFMPNFSTIAEPLLKLTRKNMKFLWNSDTQNSFE